MHRLLLATVLLSFFSMPVFAEEMKSKTSLQARAEANWRYGDERSILMSEFWVPILQDEGGVFYADLRMMGDDSDNREGNLGIGYRQIVDLPVVGQGVAGVHGWVDRRLTERGSSFHQVTGGVEWLGDIVDMRANGYVPLSDKKIYTVSNPNPQKAALSGTGIVVDTNGTLLEEAQGGFDVELGLELGSLFSPIATHTDSTRVYAGGYYFDGDHSEQVKGWRARISSDITPDIQIGGRLQHDDVRGGQAFFEATIRFPFKAKKSYRKQGLYARLDDAPERDIDIVTGSTVTDSGDRVPVIDSQTGAAVEVLVVDNTAAAGGDGSAENPYNTLSDAQAAARENTIIYVRYGDGTSANQDQGITLDKEGQQLIGSGTDFILDTSRYKAKNGEIPISIVVEEATNAPVLSNINVNGDGVTVTADDVTVKGITVDGASRDGVLIEADGINASAQNVVIEEVTAINNRIGVYAHALNDGAVSAKIQNTVTSLNSQHGVAVYDDTNGTFDVDLGGGGQGSTGGNVLVGNTLEDLAIDYDGRTFYAQNNWWGQATGVDEDDPSDGTDPQIYYGAPINDGLLAQWTFDSAWTTDVTAYDRSGNDYDGVMQGGISLADIVGGMNGEALQFDGSNDSVNPGDLDAIDGATELTISVWMKLDDITKDGDFVTKGNHLPSAPIVFWYDVVSSSGAQSGNVRTISVLLRDGTDSVWFSAPSNSINDTDWHLATLTYTALDPQGAKIYIDGVFQQAGDTSSVDFIGLSAFNYLIGTASNNFNFFDGAMDNSIVYDRALSDSEILELYRMDTTSVVDTSGFLNAAP